MRTWQLALLAGMLWAPGCALNKGAGNEVLLQSPVTGVELVESGLTGPDDRQWPRPPAAGVGPLVVAGELLADDLGFARKSVGGGYYITAESGDDGQTLRILVFDLAGSEVGEVEGLSIPGRVESWWVLAEWDPEGKRVVISFLERGGKWLAILGLVEPPSLEWRELRRVTGDPWLCGVWIGGRLILIHSNKFVWVDTDTGATTVIHERPRRSQGLIEPRAVVPVEHAGLLVFDVIHEWREPREGIWTLDLTTLTCGEVTYEHANQYKHRVLCWEPTGSLLFSRQNLEGAWDIYRARFACAE